MAENKGGLLLRGLPPVKFLTWPTADFGYGGMDRYLDSLLNMTDVCAALRDTKAIPMCPQGVVGPNSKRHFQELTEIKQFFVSIYYYFFCKLRLQTSMNGLAYLAHFSYVQNFLVEVIYEGQSESIYANHTVGTYQLKLFGMLSLIKGFLNNFSAKCNGKFCDPQEFGRSFFLHPKFFLSSTADIPRLNWI